MMLRATILIACLFITGCYEPPPTRKWTVKVVRPDGGVHKTYIVRSVLHPKVNVCWGGQLELYSDKGDFGLRGYERYERLDLIAPIGWAFDCEEAE
jgi:hypothetical protein